MSATCIDSALKQQYVKAQSCKRLLQNGLRELNLLILGECTQDLGFGFDYTSKTLENLKKVLE